MTGHADKPPTNITLINTVQATLQILLSHAAIPKSVKIVTFGGEAPLASCVNELYKLPHIEKAYNLYGPTETTTYSSYKLMDRYNKYNPNIGRPITNTIFYILNEQGIPVANGEKGELCITGLGVTDGYLNNDALTQQKYVANHFDDPYPVYYKTGDWARFLTSGEVQWLGRMDDQLKLRGHRIEPRGIETQLSEHPLVSACAVCLNEDAPEMQGTLHAFVVLKNASTTKYNIDGILKAFLSKYLVYYMIPDYFHYVDRLPVLSSGKVDRKQLRSNAQKYFREQHSVNNESSSNLLQTIQITWHKVLQHNNFKVNTNFFDAGGNSILIAELYRQLKQSIDDFPCRLVDLFVYPTIEDLYEHISAKYKTTQKENHASITSPQTNTAIKENDIAIIGYACRFPGADTLEEYWQNIKTGNDTISHFTHDELKQLGIPTDIFSNPDFVPVTGILKDTYGFDADFFDYSYADAILMDPQHRIFLELVWTALENAACIPSNYQGQIGIFAGCGRNQYYKKLLESGYYIANKIEEMQLDLASEKDYLVTRVAYKLGLTGTALNINTACSTSLVAIAVACQNLLLNEVDIAIAGGVDVTLPENAGYLYSKDHVFSKDGACRAFDKKADGTVPSSGAGVIILKRLAKAIADGDNIVGVIKGYALNNDSRKKVSFTATSQIQQKECILKAHQHTAIDPNDITYIETHGTGTQLGDPIELNAITDVFKQYQLSPGQCSLGSVKANIGHSFVAAGVAGLIKLLAMFKYKKIPPQNNFVSLNKKINLSKGFHINQKLKTWKPKNDKYIAAISSFGLGGTNAHVILQNPPIAPEVKKPYLPLKVIILSAKSETALQKIKTNLLQHLTDISPNIDDAYLYDLSYTLYAGRAAFNYRYAYIYKNYDDIITALQPPDQKLLVGPAALESNDHVLLDMLKSMATAWLNHEIVDWGQLYPKKNISKLLLPTYPFEHKTYRFKFESKPANSTTFSKLVNDMPLEHSLTNVWQNILGEVPISSDSHFFRLGGRSLSMIRLIAEVKRHFDITLTYDEAFRHSRFSQFIKLIERKLQGAKCDIEITKMKDGKSPIIILIHPGNGALFHYHNIIVGDKIKNEVYGIANPLEHNFFNTVKNLEHLAKEYIKLAKPIITDQAFILAGWSFGGTVAYEMAQQLKHSNLLKGVIMFDSWAQYPDKFARKAYLDKVLRLMAQGDPASNAYYNDMLKALDRRVSILFDYIPTAANFPVILLKAREEISDSAAAENHWRLLAGDLLTTFIVDGNHDNMLDKKHLPNFAKTFILALDKLCAI